MKTHSLFDTTGNEIFSTKPGLINLENFGGEIEWRGSVAFEPPFPTEIIDLSRGQSASNIILGGPIIRMDKIGNFEKEIRATWYLTPMGLIGLMKIHAFDGVRLKKGVKLMPVKRGQNYLVEAVLIG